MYHKDFPCDVEAGVSCVMLRKTLLKILGTGDYLIHDKISPISGTIW